MNLNLKGYSMSYAPDVEDFDRGILDNLPMPEFYSYIDIMPEVKDQRSKPWCVGYATVACLNYNMNMQQKTLRGTYSFSEKEIYDQRVNKNVDGMMPVTALDYLKKVGIEVVDGIRYKISNYKRLNNFEEVKAAMLLNGPVIVGMIVRSDDRTDFWNGRGNLGGHAVALVGYDDTRKAFHLRNSWGTSYGDKGYTMLPYNEYKNAVMEAWTPIWENDIRFKG